MRRKATEHDIQPPQSTPPKTARSNSDFTHSNDKGILAKQCILYLQEKKRSKPQSSGRSWERLCRVKMMECSREMILAARRFPQLEKSKQILAFGSEDLIAIEANYANSCRHKYLHEIGRN